MYRHGVDCARVIFQPTVPLVQQKSIKVLYDMFQKEEIERRMI
jgi:hypothetical protein